ncbi:hypothetical protein [Arthrobacter sp. ISL-95]|uniref:hypothetical protein n=1 Tax=Arthrobacter sp. ISL-95 TaxID=2819116 RepID=UPI002570531F|nr:hypothetical protein [Arthrobacter sp. ISL-95]
MLSDSAPTAGAHPAEVPSDSVPTAGAHPAEVPSDSVPTAGAHPAEVPSDSGTSPGVDSVDPDRGVDKGAGTRCGSDSAGSVNGSSKAADKGPATLFDPDFEPFDPGFAPSDSVSSPNSSPVLRDIPALVAAAVGHLRAGGREATSKEMRVTSWGASLAPGEPARRAKICPMPSITQPCHEGSTGISPYRCYVENPVRGAEY